MTDPTPSTIKVFGLEFTLAATPTTEWQAHYRHENWLSLYRYSGRTLDGRATWWTAALHDVDTDTDCPDRIVLDLRERQCPDAGTALLCLSEAARDATVAGALLRSSLSPVRAPVPEPEPLAVDPTAPHYAWLPGMRTTDGARVLKADAQTITVWQAGSVVTHQMSTFAGKPDHADPATHGCVNHLVARAILNQVGALGYHAARNAILAGTAGPAPRTHYED